MPIPPAVGAALIGGGASLIGGLINGSSQNSANRTNMAIARETNRANMSMLKYQNAFNQEMWNKTMSITHLWHNDNDMNKQELTPI